MKLTKTNKRSKGMTLLELTVVILVLLSLISILFIGARAWKRGSDRAGCILNIRNVQQAARSYANMYNIAISGSIPANELVGTGKFIENTPTCPDPDGAYTTFDGTAAITVPAVGDLVLKCDLGTYSAGAGTGHAPTTYTDW